MLILLLTACTLPTEQPPAGATEAAVIDTAPVSVGPLPPALVESVPLSGSELPLLGAITFYFNQAMDAASVEAALSANSALNGSYQWLDDSTVSFTPRAPWQPDSTVEITLDASLRSSGGLNALEPVTLTYDTVDYLRLAQNLPEQDTFEVDPTTAIVAAFTSPVVPLGAQSADLPVAFTIEPAATGQGEWLNTSTYIFYPQPGLDGGQLYTVRLNPDLKSVAGAPLESPGMWTFVTAEPHLLTYSPGQDVLHVRLDEPVTLSFNQPMDTASVEALFSLQNESGQAVAGKFSWSDGGRVMTFAPDALYTRGERYNLALPAGVKAKGGAPLLEELRSAFYAAGDFTVLQTTPAPGGLKSTWGPVEIQFNAPVEVDDPLEFISVSPGLELRTDLNDSRLIIYGYFEAEREYSLTLSGSLADIWGSSLSEDYTFSFKGEPLDAAFTPAIYQAHAMVFVNPDDPLISAQVVNIDKVDLRVARISFDEMLSLFYSGSFEAREQYNPPDQAQHSERLAITPNRNQVVGLSLNPGDTLTPGLYWVAMDPIPLPEYSRTQVAFAVVSYVQMVLKVSPSDALVWAIDTRNNAPVINVPITIYDKDGQSLASGVTDQMGVFESDLSPQETLGYTYYAVLGSPGDEFFSVGRSDWEEGISAWDFGISANFQGVHNTYYVYTDRPIYRPGQTVEYRVVVRQDNNGRYFLPEVGTVDISVRDYNGATLNSSALSLTQHGTASASFTLSEETLPGLYSIQVGPALSGGSVEFQVAEYRKPEIDTQVSFSREEALAGDVLDASVSTRYFFDAPAGNVSLDWNMYVQDSYFSLPGYQVGPITDHFYDFSPYYGGLGTWVQGGSAQTAADGTFQVSMNTDQSERTQEYTLETLVMDESGFPVSSRASITMHPAMIYIGIKPEQWLGQTESELFFDVKVVDWDAKPAGVQALTVAFSKVTWQRVSDLFGGTSYQKVENVFSEGGFNTNERGESRLSFIPQSPGVYQVEVRNGQAVTQALVWVGGPGQALWPESGKNQLALVADKDTYQPYDVASIFIPNPFSGPVLALLTLERDQVLRSYVIQISESGMSYPVELADESAPNIYFTASLLGWESDGSLGFRYGVVSIPVEPKAYELDVQIVGYPERTAPGDTVKFTIQVTDASGSPVQGEFSLSVVDEAVLALADPKEQDILSYFYGKRSLGVYTGVSLIADATIFMEIPGGLGGGGGDGLAAPVRSEFEDTAYWNGTIVTGTDGTATVEVKLPDNLTTWRVLARGLTRDTLVGEALSEVVTTKPLLVRPVAPRFAVSGDHFQIGAVVHNNTDAPIQANLALQTKGFTLDDPSTALQLLEVPAEGRVEMRWWGTAEQTDAIELIYAVEGGGYSDLTIPSQGTIPIVAYLAPQAFSTAGVMADGGERMELVSLPRTFDPTGGSFELELSSSLAGVALQGLEALRQDYPYESTERTVSRFLPNLEMFLAIQQFGLDDSALQAQLDEDLNASLAKLRTEQNSDGGWGWYSSSSYTDSSNPTVSAYVLLGLLRARDAGFSVPVYTLDGVVNYLSAYLNDFFASSMDTGKPWQLDRAAFVHYALSRAGSPMMNVANALFDRREQLNPWSIALVGLSMTAPAPGNNSIETIFSDLQSGAVRSATGAHWEERAQSWQNMSSDIFNNAVVIYALAQRDPASPLLADAVRYLMAYRDAEGGWQSSYGTAWALMALTEVMRGTAELGGDFAFSATLNDIPFATGQAGGSEQFVPVRAVSGLENLLPDQPNALVIERDPGTGRLYYRASLNVAQPVETISPLNRGISVTREYFPADCDPQDCQAVQSAQAGELVTVRVTITLPNALNYVLVEDYIPAGTEVLDTTLKTSQLGEAVQGVASYDPSNPLKSGWGWWYFGASQAFDDHIAWQAEYLPAGTYQLTYTLVILQPGSYRVIPAQARQLYFPEVQGVSAGAVFEVLP